MAGETVITVVGNLVDDPELRFTPSGAAVAKFRVASTPRTFDRQTNEWKDGESLFLTCAVWRHAAENVAESLARGMRVIVQGRLRQRSYEDREAVKRTVYELDVEEVGASLRNATTKVTKTGRNAQPQPLQRRTVPEPTTRGPRRAGTNRRSDPVYGKGGPDRCPGTSVCSVGCDRPGRVQDQQAVLVLSRVRVLGIHRGRLLYRSGGVGGQIHRGRSLLAWGSPLVGRCRALRGSRSFLDRIRGRRRRLLGS
ncbi:single-stranded DNA-binding protein [Streptomyces chartreusis]|uniref:single-stranded DNA-binding protein n=1 Tax=Streptomyces chartreusis TaxID=1969 RepID=UPI00368E7050